MAIAIFFLRFLNSYQDWKKICPKHLSRVLLSWEEKNDILSNEDRVGASCKGRSLLNCKFKYQFTFSWHVWNVAEYLVMVCSSSITWRVHCTVHTHCTLCTRSFPRAHLHLRLWRTAIDIPPPPQLATFFLTLNFNVRKWLKTCSIHCFAHSHKTVAINLPTPSFYGKNAWSCCVTPRDLIPWEPLVLFHLTCKLTLFFL